MIKRKDRIYKEITNRLDVLIDSNLSGIDNKRYLLYLLKDIYAKNVLSKSERRDMSLRLAMSKYFFILKSINWD